MDIANFKKLPLLGILRGVETQSIEPLIETVISSGLRAIEITMNSDNAAELIRLASKAADVRLTVGAGTVLTMESLKKALDAGATFIVLPTLIEDVLEYCVKNVIPVFPGALTPREIYTAWQAGATMVKVFPAGLFGPAYIKEIKAPFDKIELMACGGVTPDNIKTYFANGAGAVAFGASVFKKEWLEKGDFAAIGKAVTELVQKAQRCVPCGLCL